MDMLLEALRKQAKRLRKQLEQGDRNALARARAQLGSDVIANHASALHVIARENGFQSWPKLKIAHELGYLDRQQRAERLRSALFQGQHWVALRLLENEPGLAGHDFGLECALYDIDAVRRRIAVQPEIATVPVAGRRPILHLAFSKHYRNAPERTADMMAVAEALVAAGGDVNDGFPAEPGSDHQLSALYGALGHAGNLKLAEWLLDHGADPNDNESLYHATELETLDGLKLLMRHGVETSGTNALLRMLDFNNYEGVKLFLDYGADPNEGLAPHPSGQPATVFTALHQAASRMCTPDIGELLIAHGTKIDSRFQGHTAYALAAMRGNWAFADMLARHGAGTELDRNEKLIASASSGPVSGALDTKSLTEEQRRIVVHLLSGPDPLPFEHIQRLVKLGIDPDWMDEMELPAVQVAGWQGRAEALEWLLGFAPDLTHRNRYGGDLLGTILHGAEYHPSVDSRAHMECLDLALKAGAPLARRYIEATGSEAARMILEEWTETHPDRVVG